MNRIYKTAFLLLAGLVAFSSCYKEPEFDFAEAGPNIEVDCDDAVLMGSKIEFTASVADDKYPLSMLKAKLYWDVEVGAPVSEFEMRTANAGTYLGSIPVPFEKDLNDGIATVVFTAVNTHLGETHDTLYVKVSRPDFDKLTLTSGTWKRSMTKKEGEKFTYVYEGNIPSDFAPYITTPDIDGEGTGLTFGWDGSNIVLNGASPIPFDCVRMGTITFNTLTFKGTPFVDIRVNDIKAEPTPSGSYKAVVNVKKGDKIVFAGVEDPAALYVDPDHYTVTDGELIFNAVSGHYTFEVYPEQKFVITRRAKANGSSATYADEGAIIFMGWGVAHPVMTNQFGWDGGQMATLAEIEDGVYQFTGTAVEETDGTTLGGRWRYDYVSFKFFGQAGWGAEWKTVTLTDEAKKYLQAPGNVELATDVTLEIGATYRMTVTDCTPLDADNKFNCTIDFRKL